MLTPTAVGRCLALLASAATPLFPQATVRVTVVRDFGGVMDDPTLEMYRVGSILRTKAAQYLVYTGKPSEVRLYDSSGKLLRRLGRAGAGPGEFQGGAGLYHWTGDSVLMLSGGTQRWMLYALNGKLVREWPIDSAHPRPGSFRLHGWGIINTGMVGSRGCLLPTVNRLPSPTPWFPKSMMTDPAGRIWIQGTERIWNVYSPSGTRLGLVMLPQNFAVKQFIGDLIVGRRFDSDSAEHVTVVKIGLPPLPEGPALCDPPQPDNPLVAAIKKSMGSIRSEGERYYSGHQAYPTSMPPGVSIPAGADATYTQLNKNSYSVTMKDRSSTLLCWVSFGTVAVWDGAIMCTK